MSWFDYDIDFTSSVELVLFNYVGSYVIADVNIDGNTAKAVADATAYGYDTFTATATSTSTTKDSSSSSSMSESATG
jgi:hypothetical protein